MSEHRWVRLQELQALVESLPDVEPLLLTWTTGQRQFVLQALGRNRVGRGICGFSRGGGLFLKEVA